ncbi:uncharacterized protein LOC119379309 [Rhipicephalus sanguineus]|uniref:uncharacterized protein LOC119379309 n=1 Tax=Rhipicephalus sanguineus TaxID=34632 RepID=UPI0020C21708|nr:uncharacterized protein LOC119379309 [Rhipicephalus sanguineus]
MSEPGETDAGAGVGVSSGPSDQAAVSASTAKRYAALLAAVSCGVAILVWLFVRLASEADAGYCGSSECDRYAVMLHNSSAPAADPCEDFYEYVCARWSGFHDSVQTPWKPTTRTSFIEVVADAFTISIIHAEFLSGFF